MRSLVRIARRLVLAALVSSGGLACGLTTRQRQAVTSFGAAAVTVGTLAATTFPEMRQAATALNATDVRLGGHASPADLDEGFHVEHVAPRVAAALALVAYGDLLRALVEEAPRDELAATAARFVASARTVPGRRLSDAQYAALGDLVEGIGGMVIEARKARAIERIVPAYAADVDHLCRLLLEDFDPRGLHLAQRFAITLDRLDADADLALAPRDGPSLGRSIAVQGIQQVTAGRALLEVIGGQGRAMVLTLRQANATLVAALREEVFTKDDLRAVAMQVQSLAAAVRVLARNESLIPSESLP
jgi:hypothetical protein